MHESVCRQSADLDLEIINVNDGTIALSYPLGCTGAKLSVQLFNELEEEIKNMV